MPSTSRLRRCRWHFWRQVSCNEYTYKKLIQCLCLAKSIPVVDVPDNKELGEWAGLCEIDSEEIPARLLAQVVLPSPILAKRRADGFLMVSLGKRVGEDQGCGRAFGRQAQKTKCV